MRATLDRAEYGQRQTLGKLTVYDDAGKELYTCCTLELPWKNNAKKVSCIPEGIYQVTHRQSPKYGKHFHIREVPGRDAVLIHTANYVGQLQGCVAVGKQFSDINKDGVLDLANSKTALIELRDLLPYSFNLTIKRLGQPEPENQIV